MKKLNELTEKEFNILKDGGILLDFYPDAPVKYSDILGKRPKPKPASEIDTQGLINMMEGIFDDLEKEDYSKDDEHWCYEALVETIYGKKAWDWINKNDHG